MTQITTDICIIGAGSGGLSVAAGASQMGASVVLVESGKMGGDCLNYGCVPSKALLAAGKRAQAFRTADKFGIKSQEPLIDFQAVHDHVQGVIGAIEPNDSQERFEKLGVKVIRGLGHFKKDGRVLVGGTLIKAKKYIIATGSSPFVPPLPGLEATPYFTNETLFEQTTCPDHLIIIGGGPIGLEMAQAHLRLGAKVTVIDQAILPNDDPELVDVIRQNLLAEGLSLIEGELVQHVSYTGKEIIVKTKNKTLRGSHLLVATGRKANLAGLDLENVSVDYTPKGILVNDRLQTSNKKIYAIGDCIGDLQFTHVAGYHAGIALRNILFKLPSKISKEATPWVTYCDPELAHVGLTEAQALKKFPTALTLRFPFKDNDRALAEHATQGFIKVITKKNGTVLGASIVGKSAGDLLMPWILAVKEHKKIADIATLIAPYPTLSEVNKRVASSFFTPKLFHKNTQRLVRFLMKWS